MRARVEMDQLWPFKPGLGWKRAARAEAGERCNTYDDLVFKGQGPSTASQTAWAVMALCTFASAPPSLVRVWTIFAELRILMEAGPRPKPPAFGFSI